MNEMPAALTVRVGVCVDVEGVNWIPYVALFPVPFAWAVMYTVCADDTAANVALNAADDAPAPTEIEPGSVKAELLL